MKGTVKNIHANKGFGFIRADDNRDYFFHKDDFNGHWGDLEADIENKLKVHVKFEPEAGKKGPRAAQVSRVDWPNQSPG